MIKEHKRNVNLNDDKSSISLFRLTFDLKLEFMQRIFCASINSITDREVQLNWFHQLQSEMLTLLQTCVALCARDCYYGQTVDHCPLYV
ncbi:hypothetical protein T4C_10864 [Trichinella pseudospiralis]|uniref:Uncharacterized protein n=1 Tax=Trichinella pseudospiralis TaxID=6337 RepID=A0A0V1K1A6_TRIPS|nr:hypothetical protein T4C_10864 [Trichinella pseudospiralis]